MKTLRGILPLLLVHALSGASLSSEPVQVTADGFLNYMPSLLQRDDGSLMIVYERLDASFENGDLMVVFSDDGATWTEPEVVVAGAGNERHPSVVQRGDGSFLVYYLSDETGFYKIHHVSSADGSVWTPLGPLDLGWTTEQLVNPTVCEEQDGSLTMAYDRLSVGGYVAHSADGLSWDHLKTSVGAGSLNRVMRHTNGTYVLSYQRKTGLYYYQIDLFTKTSADRVSWSAERRVTTNQNSHDSFPIELPDGTYGLYYAKSSGGQPYDLMRRASVDGTVWGSEEALLPYAGWDTEPHPILLGGSVVGTAWPRGSEQNTTQVFFAAFGTPTPVAERGTDGSPLAHLVVSPNPSREGAEIRLLMPGGRASEIAIHDLAGRFIRVLRAGPPAEAVSWDGADASGRAVPPGVYFARSRDGSARIIRVR